MRECVNAMIAGNGSPSIILPLRQKVAGRLIYPPDEIDNYFANESMKCFHETSTDEVPGETGV